MSETPPRPGHRATLDLSFDPSASALRALRVLIGLAVAAWFVLWIEYASGVLPELTAGRTSSFWEPGTAGVGLPTKTFEWPGMRRPEGRGFAAAPGDGTGSGIPAGLLAQSPPRDARLPLFSISDRRLTPGPLPVPPAVLS